MTNPAGVCFISYQRKRADEVALIVSLLHEHGVPTWRDITDLGSAQTEAEISAILGSPDTASAILFVTPEVAKSDYIRSLEAPLTFQRILQNDGFSCIPVAAGGLKYEEVAPTLGPGTGPIDPATWNIHKCSHEPITNDEARAIAELVLDQRLATIGKQTALGAPLKIEVTTCGPAEKHKESALVADFSHCFDGHLARGSSWDHNVLPGLHAIKNALRKHHRGRKIECSGALWLAGAVALGVELKPQARLNAVWMQDQRVFGLEPEVWSLDASRTGGGPGIRSAVYPGDMKNSDLALLLATPPHDIKKVTDDVRRTFGSNIPFRGLVQVFLDGEPPITAAQAAQMARFAVGQCKKTATTWNVRGTVHLFLAAPAGLAFMIGQLLNTLGTVQTYEYLARQERPYVRAALLRPSEI